MRRRSDHIVSAKPDPAPPLGGDDEARRAKEVTDRAKENLAAGAVRPQGGPRMSDEDSASEADGLTTASRAALMAGQAQARLPQVARDVPDLNEGDILSVTLGCEVFKFADGCSFAVGPLACTAEVRPGETGQQCYTRIYESCIVLFQVEYETKLKGFVLRKMQVDDECIKVAGQKAGAD